MVGAGIYGAVAALELARAGHRVTLTDVRDDLMQEGSRVNQGRLHRGFHYPRSPETVQEAAISAPAFEARFAAAVDRSSLHLYAVADDAASQTDAAAYRRFLDCSGLKYRELASHELWNVDLVVATSENFVDLDRLRQLLRAELRQAEVQLKLGMQAEPGGSEQVVWATYGRGLGRPLQWEVVEVVMVQLPRHLEGTSVVVMDGPYCSIDPVPGGLHMLYDVVWSVRSCNVGFAPEVPAALGPMIGTGPVRTYLSAQDEIRRSAGRFLTEAYDAEVAFSMFVLRAVLPGLSTTDARPWEVTEGAGGIHVFPGKLASSLSAAARVVELCA